MYLLCKSFFNLLKSEEYSNFVIFAGITSICFAAFLSILKFYAWSISGSFTIQASMLDSLSDFFSSLINFFAIKYALKPANNKYKFGYGKAEALAGFIQSVLIIISCLSILFNVFSNSHQHNVYLYQNKIVLLIMIGCFFSTLTLVIIQKIVIKKTKSLAIESDNLHYQSDLLSDLAAIVAIVVSKWFLIFWLDSLFSLIIVSFLLFGCYKILVKSFNILMDRELPIEISSLIENIIKSNKHVLGVHELRTRSGGNQNFVQVHIELDPEFSLKKAHDIGEEIENLLTNQIPNTQIIIHLDPVRRK